MRCARFLLLVSVSLAAGGGCSGAPLQAPPLDGGAEVGGGGGHGGVGGPRVATAAPDDVAAEDWVPFRCPSCAGTPGVRAVRCDGSAELLFGAPPGAGELTSARLTAAMLVVSVRDGDGWSLWTRRAGVWRMVYLGVTGAGVPKRVGGPHVDGFFSTLPAVFATYVVYARSYDTGTDAVSYFDVVQVLGYDFFGQALPQADDLQLQFAVLGDARVAHYWYSPSNQSPGDRRELGIYDPDLGFQDTFPLEKPDQLAGLRNGSVAVLRDGAITEYGPTGAIEGTIAFPTPVTAIAPVDAGHLAFSSQGDIYCVRAAGNIVRLTDTPEEESLFP